MVRMGTIRSSVRKYSEEMDSVLNLNQSLLKRNRKAVWAKIIEILGKKDWKKADIEKVLKTYTSRDKDGKLKELSPTPPVSHLSGVSLSRS